MIEARGLCKTFRSRKVSVPAVRDLDLDVAEGEIFGFLGPNGAGKSTLMRMLTTLLPPDGGEATVAGADLRRHPRRVRRRIGYVAQGPATWRLVTACEELVMQGRLHGMSKAAATRRAAEVVDALGMADFADRQCGTYSGGQRRRVDIALGIVHEPVLLFLDEPTTGLDPASRSDLWQEVRRQRAAGTTIFVTTHYLDEADALCDRVAVMDHGTVVAVGSPAELKRAVGGDVVTLRFAGETDAATAAGVLGREPGLQQADTRRHRLRLHVPDGTTAIPGLLGALHEAGAGPVAIELHQPSLDDVFMAHTGRSLADEEGPE
ncbi:ATP-binding cassette domain-containing protein [Streptomyces sp. NPDC060035]|uniref:ATP-binding cassette domain-containing protein n=1 Tax=Streptomyces sp. NPDC060035 TaxID=3347044 RepID=UPI0036805460